MIVDEKTGLQMSCYFLQLNDITWFIFSERLNLIITWIFIIQCNQGQIKLLLFMTFFLFLQFHEIFTLIAS